MCFYPWKLLLEPWNIFAFSPSLGGGALNHRWEFSGNTRKSGFFQRFPGFSRVGVPHSSKKKIFFFKWPQDSFYPPQALKLHLQSIKLQKSFYSLNFCYFTCASDEVTICKISGVFFRRPFSSMLNNPFEFAVYPGRQPNWKQEISQNMTEYLG
jgi:hypothetical protein